MLLYFSFPPVNLSYITSLIGPATVPIRKVNALPTVFRRQNDIGKSGEWMKESKKFMHCAPNPYENISISSMSVLKYTTG